MKVVRVINETFTNKPIDYHFQLYISTNKATDFIFLRFFALFRNYSIDLNINIANNTEWHIFWEKFAKRIQT